MEYLVVLLVPIRVANPHPGEGVRNRTDLVKIPTGLPPHWSPFNFDGKHTGKKRKKT
jgi:hypothetical protein